MNPPAFATLGAGLRLRLLLLLQKLWTFDFLYALPFPQLAEYTRSVIGPLSCFASLMRSVCVSARGRGRDPCALQPVDWACRSEAPVHGEGVYVSLQCGARRGAAWVPRHANSGALRAYWGRRGGRR